jgi:hypothetical protein
MLERRKGNLLIRNNWAGRLCRVVGGRQSCVRNLSSWNLKLTNIRSWCK